MYESPSPISINQQTFTAYYNTIVQGFGGWHMAMNNTAKSLPTF